MLYRVSLRKAGPDHEHEQRHFEHGHARRSRPLADSQLDAVSGGIARSMPNGRIDVIKAMGNTKWGDVELQSSTR